MGEYKIDAGMYNGIFATPSKIVDDYLKIASGNSVKVLLAILRFSGEILTTEQIAGLCGMKPEDVSDAVSFWVSLDVLEEGISQAVILSNVVVDSGEDAQIMMKAEEATDMLVSLADVSLLEERPTAKQVKREEIVTESGQSKVQVLSRRNAPPAQEDAAKRIAASDELQELVSELESVLGRALYGDALGGLVVLCEEEHIPPQNIILLAEYCVKRHRSSWREIENQILHCKEIGVCSYEETLLYIDQNLTHSALETRMKKLFGLGKRKLSAEESRFMEKWVYEYKMSDDMLMLAYDTCIARINEYEPSYIGKILENWYKAGLSTPEDVEKKDIKKTGLSSGKKKGGKKQTPKNTSYNLEEVEKSILDIFKK